MSTGDFIFIVLVLVCFFGGLSGFGSTRPYGDPTVPYPRPEEEQDNGMDE